MARKLGLVAVSGLLAGKVWQSALSADLKPIAAALGDIGNDDGTNIYPSIPYLCWLLGRSNRSVRGWLSALRELGVLEMVGDVTDPKKLGAGYGAEYVLRSDRLPARDSWGKTRKASYAKSAQVGKRRHPKAVQTTTPSYANHDTQAMQTTTSDASVPLYDPSVQPSITAKKSYVKPQHVQRRHFWCGEIFCVSDDQHFKFTERVRQAGFNSDDLDWPIWYRDMDETWDAIDIEDREIKGAMFWLAVRLGEEIDIMRHNAAHAS